MKTNKSFSFSSDLGLYLNIDVAQKNTFLKSLLSYMLLAFFLMASSTLVQANNRSSHHVIGIEPSKDISIPNEWPLNAKKLDCVSCHTNKDISNIQQEQIDTDKGDFLRGGPYPNLQTFCQNCHKNDDYQARNIHLMLDRNGEIKKQNCLYCHDKLPERDDEKRSELPEKEQAKLRIPKETICFGCHLKTPHLNALEHQVKVDEKMLEHIKESQQSKQITLPLGDKNEVLCISCHSPHQRGVLAVESPLGKQVNNTDLTRGVHYQDHPWNDIVQRDKRDRLNKVAPELAQDFKYQQIKHEVLLRLPAKNGELCLACHTFSR